MKTILTHLLIGIFALSNTTAADKIGSVLRDIRVSDVLSLAVPELKYKSGDKDWSGGMFGNTLGHGLSFDSNTSYSVFTYSGEAGTGSSAQIAEAISKYLVSTYKLPVKQNSMWTKHLQGSDPSDYTTVFIRSVTDMEGEQKKLEYITVQVIRQKPTEFVVNLTYSTVD
jgi:hypothetical protein